MTSGVSAGTIFVLLAELGLRKPPSGCISRDIHGWQLVYRISLAARMSIILSHSEVLLGQNHRNLNCVSMQIF